VKLVLYSSICILHSLEKVSAHKCQGSNCCIFCYLKQVHWILLKSQAYSEMMEPYCNLMGGSETAQSHFAGFKVKWLSEVFFWDPIIFKAFLYFTVSLWFGEVKYRMFLTSCKWTCSVFKTKLCHGTHSNKFNVILPIVCCIVNEMSNKAINRASCVNSIIIYFIYL
jgi:hypothetical protein